MRVPSGLMARVGHWRRHRPHPMQVPVAGVSGVNGWVVRMDARSTHEPWGVMRAEFRPMTPMPACCAQ